jgi:dihydrofolate reductase
MRQSTFKSILYIATSLDNFIAKPDGNIDWLTSFPQPSEGDYGYQSLLYSIETIVMGRKTYEELMRFGGDWPYSNLVTYVISSNPNFEVTTPNTFLITSDFPEFIGNLKKNSSKHCWIVGGGALITEFLNYNLIDEMIISIIPIILGEGIPLFPNKPIESSWKLIKTEAFETGVVNLTYQRLIC